MSYFTGHRIYNSIRSFGNFLSGGAISTAGSTLTKDLRFIILINAVDANFDTLGYLIWVPGDVGNAKILVFTGLFAISWLCVQPIETS